MAVGAAQPPRHSTVAKLIKYKPAAAFNSVAKERIIRIAEIAADPLNPPKFKHKRIPKPPSGSPPVPLMRSPPRPLTVKDQNDWKVPPCTSNWKNPKGYAIPLDKRLAADGRGLQEVQINNHFANLSEALNVAEQKAREAEAMRSKVLKEMMMKEKERKEQELRALAHKARSERSAVVVKEKDFIIIPEEEEREEGFLQRERIRVERERERERESKLEEGNKKSKTSRDRERDVSEKVALGMASTADQRGRGWGEEVIMCDQRLFNQDEGMDSGFATDDQYTVYDKGLCTAQPTHSTPYRPEKDADDVDEMYGGTADDELLDKKVMKTERFKPDKAFAGTCEKTGPRDKSVEFEKEAEEAADPFGWTTLRRR